MKLPPGFGGVRKLKGKRRNPYQAVVTVECVLYEGKSKQVQKTVGYFESRDAAIMALSAFRESPVAIEKLTFKQVYEILNKDKWSDSKKKRMKAAYNASEPLYNMDVKKIKLEHLQKIADGMTKYSPESQQSVVILWNCIFNHCLAHDKIKKNYTKFVKWESDFMSKEKYIFTADQVEKFSDDLLILCYTGMRIGEYLSVKTEDIHDDCIFLNGTKTAAAVRIIPIHEKIAVLVAERLSGTYLCGNEKSYSAFRKYFAAEMDSLGIENHTIRDTRRTFASFADNSGINENMIKRLMGHSLANNVTQSRYIMKDLKELKKSMSLLKIV